MKKYDYQSFHNKENLFAWLNKHQEINVINIIYLERNYQYQVFYYIEENISGGHKGMG